ncbi:hypothetical protein BB561_003438 [Smittium simulii]|uniref:Methyltransferase type 11 domain-containing protein n=1 Tax=Smittium simulii TaxID=133385 RepID=A0A2T9YLC3_9FUNG|nr:hypothetical protein BB561_003438 [Smittium simulii]
MGSKNTSKREVQGNITHPKKWSILQIFSFSSVFLISVLFASNYNTSDTLIRRFSDNVFTYTWSRMSPFSDKSLEKHKSELFKQVSGNVLEIGPGLGTTLKYLSIDNIDKLVQVEPNQAFYPKLRQEALRLGYQVKYITNESPNIPIPPAAESEASQQDGNAKEMSAKISKNMLIYNGTLEDAEGNPTPSLVANGPYDSIISSLVLCSVDNVETTVNSIAFLLKPGGKFYFLEHVTADKPITPFEHLIYYTQRLITPIWGLVSGNCHLNRDSGTIISSSQYFTNVKVSPISTNKSSFFESLAPFIYGTAERV